MTNEYTHWAAAPIPLDVQMMTGGLKRSLYLKRDRQLIRMVQDMRDRWSFFPRGAFKKLTHEETSEAYDIQRAPSRPAATGTEASRE